MKKAETAIVIFLIIIIAVAILAELRMLYGMCPDVKTGNHPPKSRPVD